MSNPFTICVGTVGSGIFRSNDAGETWIQSPLRMPHPPWSPWVQIRAVEASPHEAGVFWAGSEVGLHKSVDGGASFDFIRTPIDRQQVWAIAISPSDPDLMLVGAAPFNTGASMIRSLDGGRSWEVVPFDLAGRSIVGATHVTSIRFDPADANIVWASVELGGLYRSQDRGASWERVHESLGKETFSGDIHCVAVAPYGKMFCTTPEGFWTSTDGGASFSLHKFPPFPKQEPGGKAFGIIAYCRGISFKSDDPKTVFVGTGDYTPGQFGAIQRSTDGGKNWDAAILSHLPNSHFYWIATHKDDASTLVAVTMFGHVYVSRDGGAAWTKLQREFGEIRGIAWAPNAV